MAAQPTPEKAVVGDKHIIVPTDLPSGLGGWGKAGLSSSAAEPPPAGDAQCVQNNYVPCASLCHGHRAPSGPDREGEKGRGGRRGMGGGRGGKRGRIPQCEASVPASFIDLGQPFSRPAPRWETHGSPLSCGMVTLHAKFR